MDKLIRIMDKLTQIIMMFSLGIALYLFNFVLASNDQDTPMKLDAPNANAADPLSLNKIDYMNIGGFENPTVEINMSTGEVKLDPKLSLDEASKLFWEKLQKAYPDAFPDCARGKEKP